MEPVSGGTYTFKIRLIDAALGGFKLTPTLAAGDFKIATASIGSGALTNLTNTPTESPAGSGIVLVVLSTSEVTSILTDKDPVIIWKDQTSPAEWQEGYTVIDTRAIEVATLAVKAKTDNLPSDPADASVIAGRFDTLDTSISELAMALATADDAILAAIAALNNVSAAAVRSEMDSNSTQFAAIKAKTDLLTSTVAGMIDANLQAINDLTVTGDGSADDKFDVV